MKKHMVLIGAALVVIACLVGLCVRHTFFGAEVRELPEHMDFGLERELSQAEEVLEEFWKENPSEGDPKLDMAAAEKYVPEDAEMSEVFVNGSVVYLDYRLEGVRYIVAYVTDGTVRKSITEIGGDRVYSVSSDREEIEVIDRPKQDLKPVYGWDYDKEEGYHNPHWIWIYE